MEALETYVGKTVELYMGSDDDYCTISGLVKKIENGSTMVLVTPDGKTHSVAEPRIASVISAGGTKEIITSELVEIPSKDRGKKRRRKIKIEEKVNMVLEEQETEGSPLVKVVELARDIDVFKAQQKALCKAANAEYSNRMLVEGGNKPLVIAGLAILDKNSNHSIWVYPPDVVELEVKLEAAKSMARQTKRAKKKEPEPIDQTTAFLFKVKLLEKACVEG